jgi:predicted metalloendopeptidase
MEVETFNDGVMESIFADPNLDPKLKLYYSSCMNENAIETLGLDPVAPILAMVDEVTVSSTKTYTFFLKCSIVLDIWFNTLTFHMLDINKDVVGLMRTVAMLHAFGVNAFFSLAVTLDSKNPKINIAEVQQCQSHCTEGSYLDKV